MIGYGRGPNGPPDAYANVGVVPCGSFGDGPSQPRALKWAENITDGTLRDTQWHEALTISCAQASSTGKMHQCGAMVE